MKEVTIGVPEGKRAEWVNGVLMLVDDVQETHKDERPVTERIKTLDDALRELGEDNLMVSEYRIINGYACEEGHVLSADLLAYLKLRIVAAALNEGWEPQFATDEYRWRPWFELHAKEDTEDKTEEGNQESKLSYGGSSYLSSDCSLRYSYSGRAWSSSPSDISARLEVKSEELAEYFGKQFVEIWADYVGPFNRDED